VERPAAQLVAFGLLQPNTAGFTKPVYFKHSVHAGCVSVEANAGRSATHIPNGSFPGGNSLQWITQQFREHIPYNMVLPSLKIICLCVRFVHGYVRQDGKGYPFA